MQFKQRLFCLWWVWLCKCEKLWSVGELDDGGESVYKFLWVLPCK